MTILILNSGSSSLSFKIFEVGRAGEPKAVLSGKANRVNVRGTEPSSLEIMQEGQTRIVTVPIASHAQAARLILDEIRGMGIVVDAAGHRFVHGGDFFHGPAFVTDATMADLVRCLPLAPNHNPNALSIIRECSRHLKDTPQFVSFDSAFHSTIPRYASAYALPRRIVERFGFRKFGFHGLSYAYVTRALQSYLGRPLRGTKLVACHLGTGGSSVAAIRDGRSLDTSMGYTPLPGLVMSTRCGDIDPALSIYLMETFGYRPDAVMDLLSKQSGLLGLSGFSSDIRDIAGRLAEGEGTQSALAFRMYVHRLKKHIGNCVVQLGGIDILVFTDDIGVKDPFVREKVCENMRWCGVELDERRDREASPDRIATLSSDRSAVLVLSIPTNEELMICLEGAQLIKEHDDHPH